MLGMNQLCASISVVVPGAESGFLPSPPSEVSTDSSDKEAATSSASGGSALTASPPSTAASEVQKPGAPRFYHVTILEAPRLHKELPSAALTMKIFDEDDDDA
uniref:Uncharacterized protein n=1 Tax=Phaeomonas parva TaxID=124430 RepID=A0A7S1UFC5_9STRA|mmetsp:Transcript_45243/g.141778  ORF Transcript_45243/g.141778 Transcript_45243/m.141778 type:complete len:103 (+) Transcript_45243:445-753(+)